MNEPLITTEFLDFYERRGVQRFPLIISHGQAKEVVEFLHSEKWINDECR